jgi:hypothetical protein
VISAKLRLDHGVGHAHKFVVTVSVRGGGTFKATVAGIRR